MINNTLGLPFEEPQETYSTSAHLYHDQVIDPHARGRIVPDKPARTNEESEERRARRSERARTRNRRRLKDGVPVDRDPNEPALADTPVEAGVGSVDDAEAEGATPRRRRRHRGRRPDRGPDDPQVDERPTE